MAPSAGMASAERLEKRNRCLQGAGLGTREDGPGVASDRRLCLRGLAGGVAASHACFQICVLGEGFCIVAGNVDLILSRSDRKSARPAEAGLVVHCRTAG